MAEKYSDKEMSAFNVVNGYEVVVQELKYLHDINEKLDLIIQALGVSSDKKEDTLSERCLRILTKTLCGVDVSKE